ncbi:MAG: response regulator [Treponema sp.]|jgi:CheY-like chemotaxis protein|nr:response regulator [Treponema sp.]
MKQILIIDESPLFREYLKLKLSGGDQAEVTVAVNALDGVAKLRTTYPDLIIMDFGLKGQGCLEVLKNKMENPNTIKIPVIVMAQHIDQKKIIELAPYGVKKVFAKPVKIDTLFSTLSELLGLSFSIDESPGIVETHVNDDIIFIEIAQGLNRDKLDLLRFKIIELIELYEIRIPKVIVMLSDIKLSFADAPNMQKLLETVLGASKTSKRYIRVLTRDAFARKFIEEQKDYEDIEVVSNLQYAMSGLLAELSGSMEYAEKKAEIIGDRILAAEEASSGESMQLRFDAEKRPRKIDMDSLRESMQNLRIAVVDDDFVIHELIKNTFRTVGAEVVAYGDGEDYMAVARQERFALVFLDLMMPKVDGFSVLNYHRTRNITVPVIVLSAVTQRDTVIRAFQMGIKSYLTKPLKPDAIFRKAIEILEPNF